MAARGGVPAPLTTLHADEISDRLPHVLPGGHGVLFTVVRRTFYWDDVTTDVRVTATGERKELVLRAVDARYLESGHLVYARDGVLLAQPFDATRFEVSGSPVAVLDNVMHAIRAVSSTLDTGAAQVAISRTGTLAYVRGGPYPALKRRLVWVDAQGRESPVGAQEGAAPWRRVSRPTASESRSCCTLRRIRTCGWTKDPGGPSVRITFGGQNAFPISDTRRQPSHHFAGAAGACASALGFIRRRATRARDPGVGRTAAGAWRLDARRQHARVRAGGRGQTVRHLGADPRGDDLARDAGVMLALLRRRAGVVA